MSSVRQKIAIIGCALALIVPAPAVLADKLTISPVGMNVLAPAQSATMTLRAEGRENMPLQFRIVRWTRVNGVDQYAQTRDVIVSPPAATLRRGEEMTLRIVRTITASVRGRECYRIIIDQLPDTAGGGNSISLALRHSLPLCFVEPGRN